MATLAPDETLGGPGGNSSSRPPRAGGSPGDRAKPRFRERTATTLRRHLLGILYPLRLRRLRILPLVIWLTAEFMVNPGLASRRFEDPKYRGWQGLVGVSQNLSSQAVLDKYRRGMFPFCHIGPMKWWSPADRAVLHPQETHIVLTQNIATPDIADALNERSGRKGDRAIAQSCRAATVLTLVATILCALWGVHLLRLFGADFASGGTALTLLVAAQLMRAVCGPSSAVLTLSGERRINLVVTALAVAVLAICGATLGSLFGLNGVASAVLIAMVFWSGASAYALYRRTGIRVDLLS